MKKQFFIFTLATAMMIGSAFTSAAQSDLVITNGIKGGLTVSKLYIDEDDLDDENSRYGFNVGIFSQMMLLESFGIQPEVLFNTKGTRTSYSGIIDQDINFNLNYIDVPLLMVYRPIRGFEVQLGPYAGFLLKSDVAYSGLLEGGNNLDKDHFRPVDFGVAAGVQFNFYNVMVGGRYTLGLTHVAESATAKDLMGDSKHSFFQVYLAFGLPRAER